MIRRNYKYLGFKNVSREIFPPSQTSQNEPSLYDILVRYQKGLDVSEYIIDTPVQTNHQNDFQNRKYKEDYLSEMYEDKVRNDLNIKQLQTSLKKLPQPQKEKPPQPQKEKPPQPQKDETLKEATS